MEHIFTNKGGSSTGKNPFAITEEDTTTSKTLTNKGSYITTSTGSNSCKTIYPGSATITHLNNMTVDNSPWVISGQEWAKDEPIAKAEMTLQQWSDTFNYITRLYEVIRYQNDAQNLRQRLSFSVTVLLDMLQEKLLNSKLN